jgi:Zn-finger nucleic acid-binding protein
LLDQLLCPKCHNIMSRYERNGVHVDSCDGCGGLFLDRGELEHLVQAEAAYYGSPGGGGPGPSGPPGGYLPAGNDRGHGGHRDDRGYRRKKARGFLDDLFDF